MRKIGPDAVLRVAGAVLTLAIGGWLLRDSLTFALAAADPGSGRVRGCYTTVENWLGVKEPSAVRRLELFAGAGVAGVTLFWFVRRPAP
ncbi:MAG TPA: hypothetical protein VOA87_21260 [Thermoanaerobaculia bacterium]|nr:hypothetical protein [Thermoanaerobaculia bacterium]